MGKRTAPRIIAGKLRGKHLKSVPGTITRPITDRVKENLFNIIRGEIPGSRFLDLFAGTGSVGIEAYSQGAAYVQFVEKNQQPYLILQNNLNLIPDRSAFSLIRTDAYKFIITGAVENPFDIIFIAPPQYKGMWEETLSLIEQYPNLCKPNGMLIVQIDPIELKEVSFTNFFEIDRRKYGSTLLLFFRKANAQ